MNRVHSKTDSLFSTLTTQIPYNIPYSQRPYKWKMSNWESVWDSLFVESEKTSF